MFTAQIPAHSMMEGLPNNQAATQGLAGAPRSTAIHTEESGLDSAVSSHVTDENYMLMNSHMSHIPVATYSLYILKKHLGES